MPEQCTYDWFTNNCLPAWERLLGPVRGRPGLWFLEIGSFEGRSACWLLRNILTHETSRIVCIDLFQETLGGDDPWMPRVAHPGPQFDRNVAAIGATHKVIKKVGPSAEILPKLPASKFDFVYVDGSHQAANVLTDAVYSWRCLKKAGIMVLDDYKQVIGDPPEPAGPKLGIDSFLGGI
jgi:predicted O-methyltransferase YrrM